MPLAVLASRVKFAEDIHTNERLSDMIQRELKSSRARQIEEYLLQEPERFFNSLVIAVYGGKPNWFQVAIKPLSQVEIQNPEELRAEIDRLTPEAAESLGLLKLSGDERMFALDGQHRLAGIKEAVKANGALGDELISVLLVAHKSDERGLQRTRRLFTTLNKTAVAVSKSEIIALDENDAAAIIVRKLVEEHRWFRGERIAFIAVSNMPASNHESLTTIGNLYDVVKTILMRDIPPRDRSAFLRRRPKEPELDKMYQSVVTFFRLMAVQMRELSQFFRASKPSRIVRKHRNNRGGSLIYRPLGMMILTESVVRLSRNMSLKSAVRKVAQLPRNLQEKPLRNVLWDPGTKTMVPRNRVLVRKIYLYMLGQIRGSKNLLQKYREVLDDPTATLPRL